MRENNLYLLLLFAFILVPNSPIYSQINRIYLVPFTHLDIGFNWPKGEVGIGYKHCIDHAIELCEKFPDLKWTIETSWQLEEWLKRTREEEKKRKLVELIKQGRIYLCAAPATMHSGILSAEEACRLFYPTYKLCRQLGIPLPKVAMQNDVPGYTIAYPKILSESGIPYFLTGINAFIGKGAEIPPKDKPFYWEGDGGAKVLTWISPSYIEAMDWGLSHFDAGRLSEQKEKVEKQLETLSSLSYPHSAVIVLASILDNLDSSGAKQVLTCVRHWNSKGGKLVVILSNPEEFFSYIEKNKRQDFPVYRGDWSGLWETVRVSLGYGNFLSLWAKEFLPVAETLASLMQMKYGIPYPWEDLEKGWRALWEYDEHTAGGGVSTDYGATLEQVKQGEWESLATAEQAYASASNILDFYLRILPVSQDHPIVFNPAPWEREEIYRLPLPKQLKGKPVQLKDARTGEILPYEILDDEILVKLDLPPFGFEQLLITQSEGSPSSAKKSEERFIENEFYRIEVDARGRVISLFDKEAKRELVDGGQEYIFNGLVMGKTNETYIGAVRKISAEEMGGKVLCEKGNIAQRIVIERENSPLARSELWLYKGIKRVEIWNTLDLKRSEFKGETFLLSFPFKIEKDKMQIRVDGPLQARRVPEDYLPPKNISSLPVNRWIEIREDEGYGVVISSQEAFLWLAGTPRWAPHQLDKFPVLFSMLLSRGEQKELTDSFLRNPYPLPDKFVFHFALTTNSHFDPIFQERFASEFRLPPLFCDRPLPGYPAIELEDFNSLVTVEPDNVRLLTIKRAENGKVNEFVIRLLEKAGRRTLASLKLPVRIKDAQICDLLEREKGIRPSSLNPLQVMLEPYGIATVKVIVESKK
ncbi:MAG: glycosyl hydrolase-related protein [bacterium]